MIELTEEDVNGGAITLVTPLTPQFVEVTVAATATNLSNIFMYKSVLM